MSHFTAAPRLVAAEGGYQEFVLRGGEHAVLAFSALAALLAIGRSTTATSMGRDEWGRV